MDHNAWESVLDLLRSEIPDEDFRRWLGATAYASDAGDQITVWVLTRAIRDHILNHYYDKIERALSVLGRDAHVRFIVSGTAEDEDDEEE